MDMKDLYLVYELSIVIFAGMIIDRQFRWEKRVSDNNN